MFVNPQKLGSAGLTQFEALTAALTSATQGFWAVTKETSGYSQRSFANAVAFSEKLSRARKLDEVIQLNFDFAKATLDDFTSQVTKVGSIYAEVANQTMRQAKDGLTVAKGGLDVRPLDESPAKALKPVAPRESSGGEGPRIRAEASAR
jgi:hypothetical protein